MLLEVVFNVQVSMISARQIPEGNMKQFERFCKGISVMIIVVLTERNDKLLLFLCSRLLFLLVVSNNFLV